MKIPLRFDGRNPVNSPVDGPVFEIPIISKVSVTYQVVVWDF